MMFMTSRKNFSEWMQNERQERDWSQADLARYAGISRAIVNKIENIVDNMINLMAIILLQTLFLPIFFLYLVKWIAFGFWNLNIEALYSSIRENRKSVVL